MRHVFEYPENVAGTWNTFFQNENPIVLEVGCGTGTYTLGLAQRFPEKNFIGIDIKGARMWHGATQAQEQGLENAAFLRTQIEKINTYFAPEEISEIWVTFPDPQPKKSKMSKRLTSNRMLDLYTQFLKKDAIVHLKTDNEMLFDFSVEVAQERNYSIDILTKDLYQESFVDDVLSIKTVFETKFLAMGIPIKYLRYRI
ncbi:MAG: tRNA ((46)-N7)-methyltransferase TrmB [Bacteroidota bacterium]